MYSIKHVEDDGQESVMAAVSVSFDPKKNELIAYGSPGPDEGARKNGVVRYGSGKAWVMNDQGKTVAVYDFKV
jgi:hypothetical protein